MGSVLQVHSFLFVLARITAFIVVVPGFSHKSLPNTAKIALSLILSWIVYTNIPESPIYEENLLFILGVVREAIIGLSMGFIGKLVFSAVEMAGQLIDFQVGYSMGAIYDPTSASMSSYYGRLFYWMGILVFFILDLHHTMLLSLMDSFRAVPPGQIGFGAIELEGFLYVFSYAFKIAISIAAPMIIVMLVIDIVMGLISRTVPQINVFMLGMPLKSLIGMFMFLVLVSTFMNLMGKTLGNMDGYMKKMIEMFR
ncbi:MAG: flagellar biosynthetic protein FliR [Clostridiaceae bacterium]